MGRRLAMLADATHQTPWTRAIGCESAMVVKGLGEGEVVRLVVDLGTDKDLKIIALREGRTPLLDPPSVEWKKYRIEKDAVGCWNTSVEVILG